MACTEWRAFTPRHGAAAYGAYRRGDFRICLRTSLAAGRMAAAYTDPEPARIVLLCASQVGYQNLCQLITRFKMREATKAEGAATLRILPSFPPD